MPINVPGAGLASSLVFGIGSHIKMAEQIVSGTKITDIDSFSKYKVAVNSMTIVPTSTLLEPGVIPTTIEQFEGVPGPLSIAGNFVIDALPLRQELFFRQLLNAPTSGITAATGNGIGDGTAQTIVSAGAFSSRSSISASTQIDQTQGPVQLTVTATGASLTGGTLSATSPLTVTISGEDYGGSVFTESVVITTATGTATTSGYFFKVNAVTVSYPPGATAAAGSFTITGTSNRKGIQISSVPGYRITPGMTMEVVTGTLDSAGNGGTVNTVTDAYISSFEFSATREEIVTSTFGVVGRLFEPNVNPAGSARPFADTARQSGATGPYGGGDFVTLQDDNTPYAGYNASLRADNGSTPAVFNQVTGISLTFDNNTQFTDRLGNIYPGVVYNRQRTATVELTLEYHSSDTDFARAYLQADSWTDVELSLVSVGGLGETKFAFPKLQLTEYPSTPVESDDFVRQTVRGRILPSGGSQTDAIRITTYGDTNHTLTNLALASLS